MADEKKCPECAELIKKDAKVCKHCGYKYTPAALAAQQKQEEEEGRAALIGCLGLLLLGGAIYGISQIGGCSERPAGEVGVANSAVVENVVEAAEANLTGPAKTKSKSERAAYKPLPSKKESAEAIATVINLNGHLCARVTNVAPLRMRDSVYEVTCVEYRGGTGTVRYIVNANTGVAFQQ
ncbi:zinc ribbon domain-containing protein [Sphingobium sp. TB-6]|uniref:zinc ribbon domain-containing protein n=1 Tax=Sphingobium sp. TB-6 TaxID=2728850 RepID=UPI0019D023D6|nr:zinc ribbon domain-containing protein [Sphingobium sp. TB-6]